MAAPINVLAFTRQFYHRETNASIHVDLKQLYIMLPQSTVALRVSRSYSKVAYLKRLKSRIVHLSSSASLAP